MTTVGLDLGHPTIADAEHWLRLNADLVDRPGVVACTHEVRGERPRVALSVAGTGDEVVRALAGLPTISTAVASAAAVDHAARRAGRAVLYPGATTLTGRLSVAELLARTAIDRVLVLGGPPVTGRTPLDTRDFVRPQWRDGLLTLIVAPGPDDGVVPFEAPGPVPCCADHAGAIVGAGRG